MLSDRKSKSPQHPKAKRQDAADAPITTNNTTAENLVSSPWTRAPGRLRFRNLVQVIIDRTDQPGYQFAILYLDLDRFTHLNDSLGREAGDRLLMEVPRRIRECLRPEDIITRLREDEYLIFLDGIKESSKALEIVNQMRQTMRPAFRVNSQEVFVTASVGVAMGPDGYKRADEIVQDAESAMHRSKLHGPGSHEVYDSRMQAQSLKQLQLETDLRGAIDRREFRLHYEPVFALDSIQVAGFEALIRWQHPNRGLVYPGEFIPLAERTGMIVPMTQWVIQEACQQLKQWQDRVRQFSSIWLSINLSPIYIKKCDFAREISDAVAESGVEASRLVLEITESELLENADNILQGMTLLHEQGIKLWIDDFGAGYSSLAYLVKFPIHALKIDRSFISQMLQDPKSAAIANAIIALAKTLEVSVIAEGVETQEQLQYLQSMNCPYVQGHYFSPSIDAATVESAFLAPKSPKS